MRIYNQILEALSALSSTDKANFLPRFFKTGKGEYAEGDKFLGVVVPDSRKIAKHFATKIDLAEIQDILCSEYHEMRLVALLILIHKFEKSRNQHEKNQLVDFYLKNTIYINNWDLVDLTSYKILGRYCFENQEEEILRNLCASENMWEKRMAIVATMYYIKKERYDLTKEFALKNLQHPHDLMHKANGWLLREMGKKDEAELFEFLRLHYHNMPRTTLRYAIEKFDETLRQDFLKSRI